jgi:hypothetical protein
MDCDELEKNLKKDVSKEWSTKDCCVHCRLRRQRYSSGVDWDPRITPVRTYNVPIHLFLPLSLNTGGVPWDHHFGDGSEPLWSSRPSEPEQRIGSYRKFVIFSDSGAYK